MYFFNYSKLLFQQFYGHDSLNARVNSWWVSQCC